MSQPLPVEKIVWTCVRCKGKFQADPKSPTALLWRFFGPLKMMCTDCIKKK